jgi:colanic acid/amylovoran biosynthesis protein
MSKVKMFTDFTSLVEGIFPSKYEHLRNGICIIPNLQMINKGAITMDDYLSLLKSIIDSAKESGRVVYLLNHEGTKDEMLCEDLRMKLSEAIDCVSGLNALEVKGMIASAYMVITSRFHGLASSLNSGVPSLATSWSHKYEELFKDYGLDGNYVLPLNDKEAALEKVKSLLEPQKNKEVRCLIERLVPEVKAQTREMWNVVWN